MLQDLLLSLLALAIYPLFLLIPGYVLGWGTNVLDFHKRRLIVRLLIGNVLSVAIFPFITYILLFVANFSVVWIFYISLWGIFIWLMIPELYRFSLSQSYWIWIAGIFTLFWIGIGIFSLIDLQIGQKIYYSIISYDYSARVPLTDAIFRTGIPPANPLFYPGKSTSISYYYFWSIIAALVSRLSGGLIDARIAFSISAVWCGIALRAIAVLYLRFCSPIRNKKIEQRAVAVLALLFVTGLDVIFVIFNFHFNPGNPWATEGWDGSYQITAWTGATLWVPNHVAGLIACLTGYMIFQDLLPGDALTKRVKIYCITALSIASATGMSIYVAMVFVIFWIAWWLTTLIVKELRYQSTGILIVGLLAFLLLIPYALELLAHYPIGQSQIARHAFAVRGLEPFQSWLRLVVQNLLALNIINLALLPLAYFVELGFFMIAGLTYFKWMSREKFVSQYLLPGVIILITGLFIGSFVSSQIELNNMQILNNTVVRGLMQSQFILLIWSADILVMILPSWFGKFMPDVARNISAKKRYLLLGLLLIGLISTSTDLLYLRFYYWVNDNLQLFPIPAAGRPDRQIGERTYALRQAYCYIRNHYPLDIVVQHNPNISDVERASNLYSMRQTVISDPLNPSFLGVPRQEFASVLSQITRVFEDPTVSSEQVTAICTNLNIGLWLIKDLDKNSDVSNSWLMQYQPVYRNRYVQVYACEK